MLMLSVEYYWSSNIYVIFSGHGLDGDDDDIDYDDDNGKDHDDDDDNANADDDKLAV